MQIAVHNLTKSFGALRANDELTLSFAAGQIHGVLGENGAGKSTLMKLLSGYLRPDAGEVQIGGKAVRLSGPADALQAGVGMVHQEPLDVPAFSALEDLLCAAPHRALPSRREARDTLLELSKRLGFSVGPDDMVAKLTVGQRQQLEIMRLLACGAKALILDEPTTGITAAQTRALFGALKKLAAAGNTVLFVSHKLDEVADLCDTVSVLRAGRLVGPQLTMPVAQAQLLELMFGAHRSVTARAEQPQNKLTSTPLPLASAPIYQLERVTLRDGRLELRDLSLHLQAGERLGLAGLDGSGQQLLLRALCGQLRPSAGRLRLAGHDLSGAAPERFRQAGVYYLPADRLAEGMVGALSLADHFALQDGAGPLVDRQAALAAACTAIADYAIKATPASPIAALSGGNQQRAMLALLPARCVGILCDQPTRGLDVSSAATIWARLEQRCVQGTALVFASSDLDELLEHSDQVLVFFGGRVAPPIAAAQLSSARLAELIGGVGFVGMAE